MKNVLHLAVIFIALTITISRCSDDEVREIQQGDVAVELIAEGITAPVTLAESSDGTGRLFVAEQTGRVRIIDAEGVLLETPFLDLGDRVVSLNPGFDERGLLGFAFHPDFAGNGKFYVYYSAPLTENSPPNFNHTGIVSEFTVSADENLADRESERIVMEIPEPQSNHNGGTLAFGPEDGYLYISLGDGGNAGDIGPGHVSDWYDANNGGNAQNIEANFLGKILRIDVDSGDPYGIPNDNPFVGETGLDEIFAYGLRNPYRFSIDMGGQHDILAGDVGQNLLEEVNLVTNGGNYGWNVKEATNCFDAGNMSNPLSGCPDEDIYNNPLSDPVIEFENSASASSGGGLAVVGGYIYRGNDIPAFEGRYIFSNWSTTRDVPSGKVYVTTPQTGPWEFEEVPLPDFNYFILGFGQDLEGEVYILASSTVGPTAGNGKIFRLNLRDGM